MPISVSCGSCSSSFSVKDEYAGRRAKCPKCGEPITVPPAPAAPPVAAPVVARPVVAKPVSPPVSPTRERGTNREDDDDKPRAKRRTRDDDADDKPRSRRRRRDDDDEPKKKSALPIILGILVGVVLVCGGGCAGLWLFYINPAIEQVKANSSRLSTVPLPPPPVSISQVASPTEENLRKVKVGMTEEQVRNILGSGISAVESDVTEITAKQPNPGEALARWRVKLNAGCVLSYRGDFTSQALVAYSARPEEGGTAVATLGSFAGISVEPIRLVVDVAPPPLLEGLSVAAVLKDAAAFRGQNLAVRGKVKLVIEHADGNQGTIVFEEGDGKHTLYAVFPPGKWRKNFVQEGDVIYVRGTLSGATGNPGSPRYEVQNCELTRRLDRGGQEVPLPPVAPPVVAIKVKAEDLAGEFAADLERAKKKYTDKIVTVTGVVEQLTPTGAKVILSGVPADGTAKAFVVEAFTSFENRNDVKKLKVGDTVTLTAKYGGFRPPVGNIVPNGVMLTGGQLQK